MKRGRGIKKELFRSLSWLRGSRRYFSTRKGRGVSRIPRASTLRSDLGKTFAEEIKSIEDFIHRRPFFSVALALLLGVVFGGLLSASVSQYILFALVGGFPIAMLYGSMLGISPEISIMFVVFLDLLVIYLVLRSLHFFSHYPKLTPYFDKIKSRYMYSVEGLPRVLNRLPLVLFIGLISFLIGPWVTTIIAFLSLVNVKTTVAGTAIGLSGAGIISLAIYKDLLGTVPNPFVVAAITLAIIFAATTAVNKMLKRNENSDASPVH